MASIRKRNDTYQIRVFCGSNSDGKKIVKTLTWKPPQGMTENQIKKELERQKILFEEQCRSGLYADGSIKLSDFMKLWLDDYVKKQLKRRTSAEYERLTERINAAMGHMRIDKIQPRHLIEFYSNLTETGVRKDIKYRPAVDFAEYMKKHSLSIVRLAEMTGLSRNTVQSCKQGKNVSYTTAAKIENALQKNLFAPVDAQKVLSSTSISKYHTLLSSVFSTAVKWQMLPANPCDRVQPPKKEHKEAAYIDDVGAVRLIQCLNGEPIKYRAIITLLLYSGMRRGEACSLEWSDIDFKHCLVSITKSSLYLPGEGIFDDEPKNKTSERVIKVPPDVIELLKAYRNEQRKTRLAMGDRWNDTDKIFTTDTGKPIHPDTVTAWFSKFIKRHNLPYMPLHSLRHTNATLLIASGTDIRTIAKRLGHSTPTTTGNIYLHAIKTADEMAADSLDDILHPTSKKQARA